MTLTLFSRSHEDLDCWKMLENCLSASCLLKEQMDFDQSCTSRLLGHVKKIIKFGWLWPLFKVTGRLRWLEKGLSAPYLLNEWMDFYQTCASILLRHGKELIIFDDLGPIFKVTGGLRLLENGLSAPYLENKWMDFNKNCTSILLWHGKELTDFGDLDPIFKVTQGLSWKMACLHLISWRNGWILTKLAQLYRCAIKKQLIRFCDLYPILKITGGLRLLENDFSAPYFQNVWMDFDQTCTATLLKQGQELIRSWWSLPIFKVTEGAQIVRKWLVCTLSPEWIVDLD